MTWFERATWLLQRQMGIDRSGTLLTLAVRGELRPLYDAIDQAEASDVCSIACVHRLRADFFGRALDHRPLRDQLQRASVLLDGMTQGDSHRWPDERVRLDTAPMLQRLPPRFALSEREQRFLGR